MCDICRARNEGPEALQKLRDDHVYFAGQLERLAADYRALGQLKLDPHSEASKNMASLGRFVVRRLVEDYV